MIARQLVSAARLAPRSLAVASRVQASRAFSITALRAEEKKPADPAHTEVEETGPRVSLKLDEVTHELDLFGPGAAGDVVPSNFEQSTGLERLQLLADLEGIDLFDMEKGLPADRVGTIADPVILEVPVPQKYIGCTGVPAGSHEIEWMNATIHKPSRCIECGSVYKLQFVGNEYDLDGGHGHH
ncbi:cytochrome c oxidase subunit VB-domain-containing protein [Lipomyces oligophaga]|uniref:cytochrome c oxidase subunit VB-domain-containing protein n=1 Tax=Lipomyces oligophaga TaxID=45792 RepID=UPI0034CD479E